MTLRNQVLLLSLSLLVLPWVGWQLWSEMDRMLRAGQADTLLASAQALARVAETSRQLPPRPSLFVPILARMPRLDGDCGDWGVAGTTLGVDAGGRLRVAVARAGGQLHLCLHIADASPQRRDAENAQMAQTDHVALRIPANRGESDLRIANAVSGALHLTTGSGEGAALALAGFWQEHAQGYRVEARLPHGVTPDWLSLQVVDAAPDRDAVRFGMGIDSMGIDRGSADNRPTHWPLLGADPSRIQALRALVPSGMRARLIDAEGWVLGEAGRLPAGIAAEQLPWWRRALYQHLLFANEPWAVDTPAATRIEADETWQALSGVPATAWRRDRNSPRLLLSAAAPVRVGSEIRGAVLLEREHQTLGLTDQALNRLVLTSVLALFGGGGLLLWFASRLSARIRRLRDAAESSFDHSGRIRALPTSATTDEIGDLTRSFSRLLDEISASQDYLKSLAGKLSHEITTPLAIVRGALDNIDTARLIEADRNCVERARRGSERLAAIVRAMSETSRIERAVAAAECEDVDLSQLLRAVAEGYRALLSPRRLDLVLPEQTVRLHGVPDLLVQAIDKLVDNARGFCPEEGWVRLALERGGESWQIIVANCGPRLPEGMRHRLFESLVSFRPQSRDASVHLGFGLYVVRLVAELHGGSAEARDLPGGEGVEFVMRLRGMG